MISVEHLTKCYGGFKAVDDLSFEIDEGHVYGFLGPNGAGKSTTMNIMTGCLSATEGSVKIDGYGIFEDAGKAKTDWLSAGAAAAVYERNADGISAFCR
ncbi:MAG: ATP-binding cassette domain-containing protein [Ruthenibacterium lactatiformans]